MIFSWFRARRRRKILAQPFPAQWERYMCKDMALYRRLPEQERQHLRQLVQVFVAEKRWEGVGGLRMTDEIRVAIASQACLLLLGLEHEYYRQVESIVVYPRTVYAPPQPQSFFGNAIAISESPMPILGQAFVRGPVILVWDAVRAGGRDARDAKNVVYHEFAHKLDMLTGRANGVPPLADRKTYAHWVDVFTRSFEELKQLAESGEETFLDTYALTNPAEFFAVATEHFFEQGLAMRNGHSELYEVLRAFYRQDPAELELSSSREDGS